MNSSILRHGEAKYQNLKIKPQITKFPENKISDFKALSDSFKDLKEDKIEQLKTSTREYIEKNRDILEGKTIKVWVSPFGRTMETAKILIEELEAQGFIVQSVSLVEQLEEVKNFYRPMLNAFVNGGNLNWHGKEYLIDKDITNPYDLNMSEYFFQGGYRKVDPMYLEELGILDSINNVETYEEITQRSKQDLSRILNAVNDKTFLFMVSHQAFTDWMYVKKDNYATRGQQPGEFCDINIGEFIGYLQSE